MISWQKVFHQQTKTNLKSVTLTSGWAYVMYFVYHMTFCGRQTAGINVGRLLYKEKSQTIRKKLLLLVHTHSHSMNIMKWTPSPTLFQVRSRPCVPNISRVGPLTSCIILLGGNILHHVACMYYCKSICLKMCLNEGSAVKCHFTVVLFTRV